MQVSRPVNTPSGQPAAPQPRRLGRDIAVCAAPIAAGMGTMSLTAGVRTAYPWAVAAAGGVMLVGSALVNASRGQPAWCACEHLLPLSTSASGRHAGQHWLGPRSLSRVMQGALGYGVMSLLPGSVPLAGKTVGLCAAAIGWELAQNAPHALARAPRNGETHDYRGNSVAHSLSNVASCMAGFALAHRLPPSSALAVALGLLMLRRPRDAA